MERIDGDAIAAAVKNTVRDEMQELDTTPTLAAVLVGDDPESETYVTMKQQACDELGLGSEVHRLPGDASESEICAEIETLNADETVNGILVQLPLPAHVDQHHVLERVDPLKDVDGLHPENKGLLLEGRPRFVPATPRAVHHLLMACGYSPEEKDVTIVGASEIVGKPLAALLMQEQDDAKATVTVCHRHTKDLKRHVRAADILITAAGVPGLITPDMVHEGQVVVDVGIRRVAADNNRGYRVVGDVSPDVNEVQALTPVPGGVGPVTVAMVVQNTVDAAKIQA